MISDTELKVQAPSLTIQTYTPDEKVLPFVAEGTANRLKAMPLFQLKNTLVMAMADPADFIALNELKRETGLDIFPVVVDEKALYQAIVHYYESVDTLQDELNAIVKEMKGGGGSGTRDFHSAYCR